MADVKIRDAARKVFGSAYNPTGEDFLIALRQLPSSAIQRISAFLWNRGQINLSLDLKNNIDNISELSVLDKSAVIDAMETYRIEFPEPPLSMPRPLSGWPAELTQAFGQVGQMGETPPPIEPFSLGGRPAELTQAFGQRGQMGETPPPPPMPRPLSGRPAELTQAFGQRGQIGETPPPPWRATAPWDSSFDQTLSADDPDKVLKNIAAISDAYTYVGNDMPVYSGQLQDRDLQYLERIGASSYLPETVRQEALALADVVSMAQNKYGRYVGAFIPTLSLAALAGGAISRERKTAIEREASVFIKISDNVDEFYNQFSLEAYDVVVISVATNEWSPGTQGYITVEEALSLNGIPKSIDVSEVGVRFWYY